jgi:pyruvate kinase
MNARLQQAPAADDASPVTVELVGELDDVRADLQAAARELQAETDAIPSANRRSALNLVHYLGLRRRDRRELQGRLAALGLSSLGRAESHILDAVERVRAAAAALGGRGGMPVADSGSGPVDLATGERLLRARADDLLGAAPEDCRTRIMVTMPSAAADDYALVRDLLEQGMTCVRINCAHDDPTAWARMIDNLRRAETTTGRRCRVLMDLAGPKLRTGPLASGPPVVKIRPARDIYGKVVAPARVWLYAAEEPQAAPSAADACLGVPADWLEELRAGEVLRFSDARGAVRRLEVIDATAPGAWALLSRTAYVVPGTLLQPESRESDHLSRGCARVLEVPESERPIRLRRGDTLVVTASLVPGRDAVRDPRGAVLTPATIGCTCPEMFDDVRAGEEIYFDDGRIGGVIVAVEPGRIVVRIERTPLTGGKLRADKGINLPQSELGLPALTPKDLADLDFVARHADIVGLSFVNSPDDVATLQERLERTGDRQPGLLVKVETQRGFRNLPAILLTSLRSRVCGVMIARGDLAVECGFERLAEVQEEILWLCEAAHVPVVWATQVLESLARTGLPSRAEITDAAMGNRAECVMLNKGPHVAEAVRALRGILRRMQDHQHKKRAMLRELGLAHSGFEPPSRSSRRGATSHSSVAQRP